MSSVNMTKPYIVMACIVCITGSCAFIIIPKRVITKTLAAAECKNLGLKLIKLDTPEKLQELIDDVQEVVFPDGNGDMWIDLEYDLESQVYYWADGTPLTWVSWAPTEPNCCSQYCGRYIKHARKIGNNPCEYNQSNACEADKLMRQGQFKTIMTDAKPNTPILLSTKEPSRFGCLMLCVRAPYCKYAAYGHTTCDLYKNADVSNNISAVGVNVWEAIRKYD